MEEFTISSFKYGLDTRKDILSSQPGTLVTLENGHINPGGEIEKRKAFVSFANVNILDSLGDAGTFGLEVVAEGVMVFGSALPFGATVTQGQPTLVSAMPAGVTYRQLVHPFLYNDSTVTYDRTTHRMTAALASTNYNGDDFVIARFNTGSGLIAWYFNGVLAQHSINGLLYTGHQLIGALSTDLARQVEAIGWKATANVDEFGAAQTGSTIIESPQSNYFTPIPFHDGLNLTGVSALYPELFYNIGWKTIGQDGPPTPGEGAKTSFRITVNTGTFTLTAPRLISTTLLSVDLCGGAISAGASAAATAIAIANAVNDLSSMHGYVATASSDEVAVFTPVGYDVLVAMDLTVTVTTGTVVAGGLAPVILTATVPSPLSVTTTVRKPSTSGSVVVGGSATVTPKGGTPSYTYFWEETIPGASGITFGSVIGPAGTPISSATTATASLSIRIPVGPNSNASTTVSGNFKCLVTDAEGQKFTVYLTVNFTLKIL